MRYRENSRLSLGQVQSGRMEAPDSTLQRFSVWFGLHLHLFLFIFILAKQCEQNNAHFLISEYARHTIRLWGPGSYI
jgi:hypothetical protein